MESCAVALMHLKRVSRVFPSYTRHKSVARNFGHYRSTGNENIFLITFYDSFLVSIFGRRLKQPIQPHCQGFPLTFIFVENQEFFWCQGESLTLLAVFYGLCHSPILRSSNTPFFDFNRRS